MPKWEYTRILAAFYIAEEQIHSLTTYRDGKRVNIDFIDNYVSQLGHEGWELVNAQVIGVAGDNFQEMYYFKRPAPR